MCQRVTQPGPALCYLQCSQCFTLSNQDIILTTFNFCASVGVIMCLVNYASELTFDKCNNMSMWKQGIV